MIEKGKTYILGTVGRGVFATGIQWASDSPIKVSARWSHVAVLFYHWVSSSWVVVESLHPDGVRLLTLDNWMNENWNKKALQFFEYQYVSPQQLLNLLGEEYGLKDVAALGLEALTKNLVNFKNNNKGIFCAELIALCDNGVIQTELNKKPHEIKPIDFQQTGINTAKLYDLRIFYNSLGNISADASTELIATLK